MHDIQEIEKSILLKPSTYIQSFFQIKSKDRKIIPFIFNEVQNDYVNHKSYNADLNRGQRDIILKARQHGFTTLKMAEYIYDALTNFGVNSVIIGHDAESMEKLLDAAKFMYNSLPPNIKPVKKYDNKGEIYFPKLNSRLFISTYRQIKLRSQTINNILFTEVAFWEGKNVGDLIAGMTESVPIDGNITFESTPKGIGGHFWRMVLDAKKKRSIYKLFVYPWFVNKSYVLEKKDWGMLPSIIKPNGKNVDYDEFELYLKKKWKLSDNQLMWRRYKMLSLGDMRINSAGDRISRRFAQEYECSFCQSGSPVFDSSYLLPSTNFHAPVKNKRYVHGADTSEGIEGGNYSVFYTMDFDTGEIVNKIRGLWKPFDFAKRIHSLGMSYGGLVGVEINNTGHAVVGELVRLFNEEAEKMASKHSTPFMKAQKMIPYRIFSESKRYGWNTNTLNRKVMFVEGEEALRNKDIKLAYEDEEGIEELIACQYNNKMKEEAPDGMNDDAVMALLICWQMRKWYGIFFKEVQRGVRSRII